MYIEINGIQVKHGDIVEYKHNDAGGGVARKEVIFDDAYGVLVERPYNVAKHYHLANLDFKLIEPS